MKYCIDLIGSNNRLSDLPMELSTLENLQIIHLSMNKYVLHDDFVRKEKDFLFEDLFDYQLFCTS